MQLETRGEIGRHRGVQIELSTRLAVPEDVLSRDLGSESVLLNLDTESYFGLDEVGASMWKALTKGHSVAFALKELSAVYDVAPHTLERDLLALAGKLLEHGLLELDSE